MSVHDGGMRALTRVRPLAVAERFSLLEVRLLTGRTHQIRVHLAHAGHPVVGDDKYGDFELNRTLATETGTRLMLHAHRLAFAHPVTKTRVALGAPWPDLLRAFADRFSLAHAH